MKRLFKHKFLLFGLLTVVIIAIALVFTYQKLDSPETIALKSSTNKASETGYNINLTPKLQSDQYVSFDYPTGLSLRSTALASPKSVDSYIFFVKDIYSWSLDINISTTPTGQLTELSSYQFRLNNPSEYSLANEVVNGRSVAVMTDNSFDSGFSKVAYLVNGNDIATVSLIGDDSSGVGPLVKTFNMVLDSWKWH